MGMFDLFNKSKINELEAELRSVNTIIARFSDYRPTLGGSDGVGKIKEINSRGKNFVVTMQAPPTLYKYMIPEGSIAIDGISLTISKLTSTDFSVSLIPHSWDNTIFHSKKIGDSVNIEVDMMAKYLENFLRFDKEHKGKSGLDLEAWYKEQN